MKISVLTPTYNRGNLLKRLYTSLIENSKYDVQIEWLIMNDGSTDNTNEIIDEFVKENKIDIKYYVQENKGKMTAINNLMNYVTGDIIIDCDSDDYFTDNAFEIIKQEFTKHKDKKGIYGLCFLKYDQNGNNMGNKFQNGKTTMFDLYFKEGEDGEKTIAFYSNIRKQYKHELENNERFITEARMYHKMDENYQMICINKPIMICEYQKDGYTNNIKNQFKENPFGYYKYFQEILQKDMKGVKFRKRIYVIKHYILFIILIKNKLGLKDINGRINKILVVMLYVPGKFLTPIRLK